MASTVIDLLSSDSEEDEVQEVQSKAKADRARRQSKPVTPDDRKQVALFSPATEDVTRKHKSKKIRPLVFGSPQAKRGLLDDSDGDDDLPSPIAFHVSKKNSSIEVTKKPAPITINETRLKENRQPKEAEPQPSSPTKKQKRPTETASVSAPSAVPVFNPYAKPKAPAKRAPPSAPSGTSLGPLIYPNLSHSTLYEDVRPKFILAFWKYAQTLVHASHNLGKMDQFCRRIHALALSEFPIRSLEEYCQRFTSTTDVSAIQEALRVGQVDNYKNLSMEKGKYVSIAEATLVALLDHAESQSTVTDHLDLPTVLKEKDYWVSLSDLLPLIDAHLIDICPVRLVLPNQPDNGAQHYLEPSTRSAQFKQIEKLQSKVHGQDMAYIKAHKQKGQVYYELTPLGYHTAIQMRQRTFPCPPGHYRTSNLCQVPEKFQGICLAVDRREGGGPKKRLHFMSNKLDTLKIPYFVRNLDIGDYCFFAGEKLLPVMVERKSVQDVAASIHDGRWQNQKRRMYQGQYVFGYHNCRMAYIIEGNQQSQQLTGGYMGDRRYNVTRDQLDQEIESLEKEGFEVLRTLSMDHSMVELSRWATCIRQDYETGKLKPQYTYDEFLQQVAKIPRQTDFSRIAKDHALAAKLQKELEGQREDKTLGFEIQKRESTTKTEPKKKPTAQRKLVFGQASTKAQGNYAGWTIAQLKAKCEEYGLPKTGKKDDLMARLNGPKPPKVWLDRKARNVGKVPSRHNTCGSALLVALYLEQSKSDNDWKGMTKEELYPLAESLDISKDPFSGVATGPFKYDGWSAMTDLRGGEIPLVVLKKGRFLLTTSSDVSGLPLAKAMHRWCHEHNICSCREHGYDGLVD